MKKIIIQKYKLLHGHGNAGPNNRRSYIQFGTYKTIAGARKNAREYKLESYRIVPKSKVKPSKLKGARGLYYIAK